MVALRRNPSIRHRRHSRVTLRPHRGVTNKAALGAEGQARQVGPFLAANFLCDETQEAGRLAPADPRQLGRWQAVYRVTTTRRGESGMSHSGKAGKRQPSAHLPMGQSPAPRQRGRGRARSGNHGA